MVIGAREICIRRQHGKPAFSLGACGRPTAVTNGAREAEVENAPCEMGHGARNGRTSYPARADLGGVAGCLPASCSSKARRRARTSTAAEAFEVNRNVPSGVNLAPRCEETKP